MVNKKLFRTSSVPQTDTKNEAGGVAYKMTAKHALAQFAATGTLHGTYYASGATQLQNVQQLAQAVEPKFLAKLAVYARQSGYMKDMPALFCAILAQKQETYHWLDAIFNRVINNGRMLRNFVQIIRSGALGRKSISSSHTKRLITQWIKNRGYRRLLNDSVGNDPSMADIIKMIHPVPQDSTEAAFYGYLIGKCKDQDNLPEIVKQFEAFKANPVPENVPNVEFRLLTGFQLPSEVWAEIAKNGSYGMTRMNLMTFQRHNVFDFNGMEQLIAERLSDPEIIYRAKQFPFSINTSLMMTRGKGLPLIEDALEQALEYSFANVPEMQGNIVIAPDVSGSMQSPATGNRGSATSVVSCLDVAALYAAAFFKKAEKPVLMPFAHVLYNIPAVSKRDTAATIANTIKAHTLGGGTEMSLVLEKLARDQTKVDAVVFISDNQSWIRGRHTSRLFGGRRGGTATMEAWRKVKKRNPKAKMICIDIQPYDTTQAPDNREILNVGGFSDRVFDVVNTFLESTGSPEFWVKKIEESVEL